MQCDQKNNENQSNFVFEDKFKVCPPLQSIVQILSIL